MSYLVLARKYRPQTFKEVSGQEHVTTTLTNSIKRDKVAHAYLFAGPRGVGKTSIARIFSKSLNCEKGSSAEPCCKCNNCIEITAGTSLAVREIDGASHNSVDNVRDLIDSFRSLPPQGNRYKIYIIDEVHMLSTSAFNALLKSLEEPPPNTVFILATTELHKIPDTVISRCQRFDLRALPLADVESCMKQIAKQEELKIDEEVYSLISRLSEGSMRDAQSLLERIQAFCEDEISLEEASKALGVVSKSTLLKLSEAIFQRNTEVSLATLSSALSTGIDPVLFLKEFVTHWRELLVVKFSSDQDLNDFGITQDLQIELKRQVGNVSGNDLQDLVELARLGADTALRSNYVKYALEALLVRMSTREKVADLAKLIQSANSGIKFTSSEKKNPKSQKLDTIPIETKKIEPVKKVEAVKKQERQPVREEPKTITTKPVVKAESEEAELSWGEFISHVGKNSQPVLMEHLRRLAASKFIKGTLLIDAPEFTVKYFADTLNKKKLENMLCDFTNSEKWSIKISSSGECDNSPGSINFETKETKMRENKNRTDSALNHPSVKALKELFPQSEVERVEIK